MNALFIFVTHHCTKLSRVCLRFFVFFVLFLFLNHEMKELGINKANSHV
jgi:hypothetical protein